MENENKIKIKTFNSNVNITISNVHFNANVVQATEPTKTPQEILNLVPDTIEVDMLESEVFIVDEDNLVEDHIDLINQKLQKVFTDNKIDLKAFKFTIH